MSHIVQTLRNLTSGTVPSAGTLAEGQLAVNIPDQLLWVGDAAGDPVELIGAGGGGGLWIGDAPPADPLVFPFWWNSTPGIGELMVSYGDPDSVQWVRANSGMKGDPGATGPQGPIGATGDTGPQGIQGEQGVIGPIGVPGSIWYTGPIPPDDAIGIDDDKYLGTDGIVYDKIGGTWVASTTDLTGPIGLTGPPGPLDPEAPIDGVIYGRQDALWVPIVGGGGIFFGDLPPIDTEAFPFWWDSNEGELMVWFIDVDSSQWVRANSGLRGPQGIQGNTGPIGLDGPAGPIGVDGPIGPIGVDGPIGPEGPTGPAGAAGQFAFTVVPQAVAFTAANVDGTNVLYDISAAVPVTIPTATTGAFTIGSVITLSAGIAGITIDTTGLTVRLPAGKAAAPYDVGAIVSIVYLADDTIQIYGDLADA